MASTVVVGVTPSPSARSALTWAANWATLTGSELRAIHVIAPQFAGSPTWYPQAAGWATYDTDEDDRRRAAVTAMFDEVHPRYRWTLESIPGPVGPVLIEASHGAILLIVGTRQLRGLGRVFDGSVSEHCLRHATCPVVVVPAAPPVGVVPQAVAHAAGIDR